MHYEQMHSLINHDIASFDTKELSILMPVLDTEKHSVWSHLILLNWSDNSFLMKKNSNIFHYKNEDVK